MNEELRNDAYPSAGRITAERDAGEQPSNLLGVLDELSAAIAASPSDRVSVADIQSVIGERSFGPMLLIPGLIGLSPIGAIPGLPGIMAIIELLFAWQILLGRRHIWLPESISRRSIARGRLARAVEVMRPYASWVDLYLLWPRLTIFTSGPFFFVIAAMCVFLSLIMPIIELVPLAGILPNAALTAFGLAVTAHDGVWALLAFLATIGSIVLLVALF
jgi:hypothetical protein